MDTTTPIDRGRGSTAGTLDRLSDARARARAACERSAELLEKCRETTDRRRQDGDRRARPGSMPSVLARLLEAEAERDHLRAALATRDLIWTAKVLIAGTTGYGPDEAHALLVQQSQYQNRKLRDVAADIVASSGTM